MSVLDNDNPGTKTYVQFRAYIKNFTDNYSGEWDDFKYLGRAEDFYRYKGFSRRISLDFDVDRDWET